MHPLRRLLTILCFFAPLLSYAQLGIPDSAQVILYFPHFADGGPPQQQWQTKFTFVNPNPYPVAMLLNLYGNDGSALSIDFGSGATSSITFTVPANGTRIYRSRISPTLVTGWAEASATGPIQATVAFRELLNGVAAVEITAEATLPSQSYSSAANALLGVAVANIYSSPVSVSLAATDSEGNTLGQRSLSVPPHGHISFNLYQQFQNLPPNFEGSIILSIPPPNSFLAWTVNADPAAGTISSLPPGRAAAPVSQWDRIWMVYWKLIQAYLAFPTTGQVFASSIVQLQISSEARINALASNGSTVQINYALAELISDSPSELAFIMAHEMGHIYQQRTGQLIWRPDDREWDADFWGLTMSMLAGYDPYAGAGALAKLAMATNTAGLGSQLWEDYLTPLDPHGSFNTRIQNMYDFITSMCSSSVSFQNTCAQYKASFHPHFPTFAGSAPLSLPNGNR